jgi:hypothetical protein
MSNAKFHFMSSSAAVDGLPRTRMYLAMYPWLLSLAEMFGVMYSELPAYKNHCKPDGLLAYTEFKAIIDRDLDTRPPPRSLALPEIWDAEEDEEVESDIGGSDGEST